MPTNVLLPLAAACLALLAWLPLGLAGVPLDTPYGRLHLNWAGAGTFALAIYPPLFRLLVGVPLAAMAAGGATGLGKGLCDERWSLHWALLRQLGDAPWGQLSDANC